MPNLSGIDIPSVIGAIGALGLASFALVDATKVCRGGVSNAGFLFIERAVKRLLPSEKQATPQGSLLDLLHANWINGIALADQKAIAKSLIKLRLSAETAPQFAAATSTQAEVLHRVGAKMTAGGSLVAAEANELGRFDLALSAILDEGYQRADQRYRNLSQVIAAAVATVTAVLGGWAVSHPADAATGGAAPAAEYFFHKDMWISLLCGVLATPLAPISKDVASVVQAGMKLAQSVKR
jgi:hypothetical protein